MSINKRIREMTSYLRSNDCDVLVVKTRKHIKLYVKKMGNEKMFVTSASPSDPRSAQNIQGEFKRWLKIIDKGEYREQL
jgi:hypothetical protein